MTGEHVLLIDHDRRSRRFVETNLRLDGFEVLPADIDVDPVLLAHETQPALVLLDVTAPDVDGAATCRRLRGDPRTSHIPVVLLTTRDMGTDAVVGLAAGADDHIVRPVDPAELVARIRTVLRRSAELRGASPLTGLPGNHRIEAEIAQRLHTGEPLAVAYADLNDFKSYNDHYGFLEGDRVLQATADLLRDVLVDVAGTEAFLGHIGGDDFVILCDPAHVDAVCRTAIERFDAMIPALYAAEDRARGYIEQIDRRGEPQRYGMVSLAIGVTTAERHRSDHRELVRAATEMKAHVKRTRPGVSSYAADARA